MKTIRIISLLGFFIVIAGCSIQPGTLYLDRPVNNGRMNLAESKVVAVPVGNKSSKQKIVLASLSGSTFKSVKITGTFDIRVESGDIFNAGNTNLWTSDWMRVDMKPHKAKYFVILPVVEGRSYAGNWELTEIPLPSN